MPIYFKSYKSKRIPSSVIVGEVIAFSDMFDVAAMLSQKLEIILGRKVPV